MPPYNLRSAAGLVNARGAIDVYAALVVYYADHRDELETDIAEDRRLADESERRRLERPGQ